MTESEHLQTRIALSLLVGITILIRGSEDLGQTVLLVVPDPLRPGRLDRNDIVPRVVGDLRLRLVLGVAPEAIAAQLQLNALVLRFYALDLIYQLGNFLLVVVHPLLEVLLLETSCDQLVLVDLYLVLGLHQFLVRPQQLLLELEHLGMSVVRCLHALVLLPAPRLPLAERPEESIHLLDPGRDLPIEVLPQHLPHLLPRLLDPLPIWHDNAIPGEVALEGVEGADSAHSHILIDLHLHLILHELPIPIIQQILYYHCLTFTSAKNCRSSYYYFY